MKRHQSSQVLRHLQAEIPRDTWATKCTLRIDIGTTLFSDQMLLSKFHPNIRLWAKIPIKVANLRGLLIDRVMLVISRRILTKIYVTTLEAIWISKIMDIIDQKIMEAVVILFLQESDIQAHIIILRMVLRDVRTYRLTIRWWIEVGTSSIGLTTLTLWSWWAEKKGVRATVLALARARWTSQIWPRELLALILTRLDLPYISAGPG